MVLDGEVGRGVALLTHGKVVVEHVAIALIVVLVQSTLQGSEGVVVTYLSVGGEVGRGVQIVGQRG